jgi:hypothetical protein
MSRKDRQPWPMRWVVVAIVAILVPYTFITLHYRKPGKPFSPYGDLKERAQVARLLDAGFGRNRGTVTAVTTAPQNDPATPTASTRTPGGLPPALRAALLEAPALPIRIGAVTAPATLDSRRALVVHLQASLPPATAPRAELYRAGQDVTVLLVLPEPPHPAGETPLTLWRLEFPAGVLPPDTYRVEAVGQENAATWTLVVTSGSFAP